MLPVNKTATVRDDGDLRRMHRNHKMKRKQSRKKRQASAKKEVEEIEHLEERIQRELGLNGTAGDVTKFSKFKHALIGLIYGNYTFLDRSYMNTF